MGETVDGGTDGGWGGMTKDVGGLNWKGLYSRERQPKAAAAGIRARYTQIELRVTNRTNGTRLQSMTSS